MRNLVEPIVPEYKRAYHASLQKVLMENKVKLSLAPNGVYHQDIGNRQILFDKLPKTMRKFLLAERRAKYLVKPPTRVAIRTALAGIVAKSAFTQSLKGLVTAGVFKSGEYILQKLSKSLLKPFFYLNK